MPSAPPAVAEDLPAWPAAWYAVARAADIPVGRVTTVAVAERALVVFRGSSGRLAALAAHCPHMGAHLGRGEVAGDALRCPLHHFAWDARGGCAAPQAASLCARTFPLVERCGLVFVHVGGGPLPEPPAEDGLVWTAGRTVTLPVDWRAVAVNAFDLLHLKTVPGREVLDPGRFVVAGGTLRFDYATRVLPGSGFASWLTRLASGGRVEVTQLCQGPWVRVESRVGRVETCAVFGLLQEGSRLRVFNAFGTRRRGLFGWLGRQAIRAFYRAYLRKDFSMLEGMRLRIDAGDPGVRAISSYLAGLPSGEERS